MLRLQSPRMHSAISFLSTLFLLLVSWGFCLVEIGLSKEPIRIQMASDFALSPDGKTLVFRWANDLWSTKIEGGPIRRLTNNPSVDSDPKFSPDGTKIAFISNRSGSNQIYIMPAEGGIPEQKTFHSEGY